MYISFNYTMIKHQNEAMITFTMTLPLKEGWQVL